MLVKGLALECGDRLARERKYGFDVCGYTIYFVSGDLQERLPDGDSRVEERDADAGVQPVCTHRTESGLDFFIVVGNAAAWGNVYKNEMCSVKLEGRMGDQVTAHARTYVCFRCL